MIFRNRSPAHGAKNNGRLKMRGEINELKNRLTSYRWEWIIIGCQILTFGSSIWLNALNDASLHPVFDAASKPLWVFLPFIIGIATIYVGFAKEPNQNLVKLTIYSLTVYWAVMTYLLLTNDSFNNHVSNIASISWAIVPKVWLMAWRATFSKGGTKL